MERLLVAAPVDRAAYAAYGDLVAPGDEGRARPANQGSAQKWPGVAALRSDRPGARLDLAVFRCTPPAAFPLAIALLERHPCSTQAFLPLRAARYLVVVALGGAAPDLGTLAAFVVPGDVGITYHPGVWHHPMIALDAVADFACLVHEDGTPADCDEHPYASPPAHVALPAR